MIIGFDYGTANCSVAQATDDVVKHVSLDGEKYIPSTLCAPTSETISEYLFKKHGIHPTTSAGEAILKRAMAENYEQGINVLEEEVLFGKPALDLYLQDPKDIYYIKSPKSFLGASGLRDMQLAYFEDLVCAMMTNIKIKAEQSLQQDLTHTVIGRPVNFLGRGGETSNQQAVGILERAANRAGFKEVSFQYEPVAAGLEYENALTRNQNVLVVDIGGGTTDCSMIQMGPQWRGSAQRDASLLAHSGQMIGGNDLDIHIAFQNFMTEFGKGSRKISGLEMPISQYWHPILINNVPAQREFYSRENLALLKLLVRDAVEKEKVSRLIKLHQDALGYGIVAQAERAKIDLEANQQYIAQLNLIDETLAIPVSKQDMEQAIKVPREKIQKLVAEAVTQSGIKPDVIFMTGGSARSQVLRSAVQSELPNIEVVSGNYFGSVTAGLARWADIIYR
ncbi:molecular chaperone [Vibrio gallicus]|uniref:molecular chaperone n=1 Tax=Vibrio gallicus TaxID=190897 RepID=UPI0021C4B15A|nr:molecular chaperone [Vibrio gallicus]